MAKDKKADKKADKKVEKAEAKEHKFGVSDIAEKLGIKEASVRVQLRNKGIEKDGKSYGWDTKAELQEVIDQLKTSTKDDDDKPAKKSKKADKADDGKKAKKDKKASKKSKKDEDDD